MYIYDTIEIICARARHNRERAENESKKTSLVHELLKGIDAFSLSLALSVKQVVFPINENENTYV